MNKTITYLLPSQKKLKKEGKFNLGIKVNNFHDLQKKLYRPGIEVGKSAIFTGK